MSSSGARYRSPSRLVEEHTASRPLSCAEARRLVELLCVGIERRLKQDAAGSGVAAGNARAW